MLRFKPIRVFVHVWSDWPVPRWRGWPHASLSPMLRTIWQRGLFSFHSPFFSVSLQSAFSFFYSSHLVLSAFPFSFLFASTLLILCVFFQRPWSEAKLFFHSAATDFSRYCPKEVHVSARMSESASWDIKWVLICQRPSTKPVWGPVVPVWGISLTPPQWVIGCCVPSPPRSISAPPGLNQPVFSTVVRTWLKQTIACCVLRVRKGNSRHIGNWLLWCCNDA